jgi:hypothetical protein
MDQTASAPRTDENNEPVGDFGGAIRHLACTRAGMVGPIVCFFLLRAVTASYIFANDVPKVPLTSWHYHELVSSRPRDTYHLLRKTPAPGLSPNEREDETHEHP